MSRQKIPGLAVAVVRGDTVLACKGYGLANIELDVPITPATMFQSGSLGKQFTAAAVMALVEEGKLKLDDSIRKYLPDAPKSWEPIALRHLLSHTSGIPDYTDDTFDYRADYSDADLAKMAFALTLEFPAGTRWNYSNTGYVLLGIILNKAAGRPYWETLRERVFTPAGMKTARINSEADIVPHRSSGYRVVDGAFKHQEWVSPTLNTTADGSLLFSLEDLIAWNRTVRARSVLSQASWTRMLSPVTLNSGRTFPYGYGWAIEQRGGQTVISHGGSWQGFRTQFTRFERSDLAVIVLANSSSANPETIANRIAAAVDPALTTPAPSADPVDDKDPRVTALVRKVLEKTARGELSRSDFEFVRATSVAGMSKGYARLLGSLGEIRSMALLARDEEGDDRIFVYRVGCAKGAAIARVKIGPGGGLTGLQLRRLEGSN
jgi:CubicO group peptidase (beta-lactamase class C family)